MTDANEENYIDFMVKYNDWVSIKRLMIDDKTTKPEIAFHLSNIYNSIEKEIYNILGIDKAPLDDYCSSLSLSHSYDSLGKAIASLESTEAKKAVTDSCSSNANLKKIAEAYLVSRIIHESGYDFFPTVLTLFKIYPELKDMKRFIKTVEGKSKSKAGKKIQNE
ncbi:MAG: DUF2666 family protein [Candidatus Micrarchaeia archaeon]